jgi:nucleoside-diphosphate-sugar epimerase
MRLAGVDGVIAAGGVGDLDARHDVGPDVVLVNCVGYYGPDETRLKESNVEHARAAAELARAARAGLVHVSSSAVFDGVRKGTLIESSAPNPRSSYGRTKLAGEREVRRVHSEARIVRPAKIFGGNDPRDRLHALIRHVQAGRPLPASPKALLWANFVWLHHAAQVLAGEALVPAGPAVLHLASPLPWTDFVGLLATATGEPLTRPPRFVEGLMGFSATALERIPGAGASRKIQRLLELWDRRQFIDTLERLGRESVLAGLRDVAARVHR